MKNTAPPASSRFIEIRDAIHGSITVEGHEIAILDSPYFQRLRQIKQLGFSENSYPSATHNRYVHSLGAMETATRAFQNIFRNQLRGNRFRPLIRLAALLHDVGHGPLSHASEFAMPKVHDLQIPLHAYKTGKNRQANHEDYTLKIILDSSLTPLLERAGADYGFKPIHIAALIDSSIDPGDDFFHDKFDGQKVDLHPVLHQLISSELDADRMDYLRRDAWYAGVSYGSFDFDWLVRNLTFHVYKGKAYLALQHRALYAFEDFLLSRFHMFLMVYFHYKSVVFEEMLAKYMQSPDCDYRIPSNIEEYATCTDSHLYSHLAKSENRWAKLISARKPYRMLVELHSGIPATRTSAEEQRRLLTKIQKKLKAANVEWLESASESELSKYFRRPGDPIFVRYDNQFSEPNFIPLDRCTDVFQKYGEKRTITRLYVSPEDLRKVRLGGRDVPLRYEEDPLASQASYS